jgi:hypothetical protein
MHLHALHDFSVGNLLIFILTPLCLIPCLYDKFKTARENADLLSAIILWGIAFVLAAVLFMSPSVAYRAFYSAGVLSCAAFMLVLKYIAQSYKINIFKYFAPALLAFFIVLLPSFTLPYVDLYVKNKARIAYAQNSNDAVIYIPKLYIIKGPFNNFNLSFIDPFFAGQDKLRQLYGIKGKIVPPPKYNTTTYCEVI